MIHFINLLNLNCFELSLHRIKHLVKKAYLATYSFNKPNKL